MAFIESQRIDDRLILKLGDHWCAAQLNAIQAATAELSAQGARSVQVDAAEAEIDLAGSWALRQLIRRLEQQGAAVAWLGSAPRGLQLVQDALERDGRAQVSALSPPSHEINPFEQIGRTAVERWGDIKAGLNFVGRTNVTFWRALGTWRRLRPISIARHVFDTGITAIPIVALIAFLITVIIAYLSADQLRNYGADIYVVDLITVGVLRELGVLLTAIIVAGRTGSAFAAEIGSMQLNEEVDALDATGVDPIETLVLPRVWGLVIALPLLTFIADLIGMVGGALLCLSLLDMPLQQFVNRANESIGPMTFWVGIIKAPVFALLIALSGTYRGMQVRGSSRELGRLTTVAVVQAIFLVLLADALFAVLFMLLDI